MDDEYRKLNETAASHNISIIDRKTRIRPKYSHNQHTGKRLYYAHTSYTILFFILSLLGIFLVFTGQQMAKAANQPISSTINVQAVNYGEAPTTAATIDVPANNSAVKQSIVTVGGTCQAGYIVEVYRGDALSGTIICSITGNYSLNITVVEGKNILVAKTKNGANVYGPDSNTVVVLYKKPASGQGAQSGSGANQQSGGQSGVKTLPLLLYTQPVQVGLQPEQILTLGYEIDGGKPAYALTIDWGDGTEKTLKPHSSIGDYEEEHSYQEPGQYTIKLYAVDSLGNEATIQAIVIINGKPPVETGSILQPFTADCSSAQNVSSSNAVACIIIKNVNLIWPAFLIALLMTLSFWLGEKVMDWRYKKGDLHTA